MSGDFEKNISQRMDGFQLTPDPQIWERVAAALPEKRRRRFAIWWLLPLAACLGGIVWLMIDGPKNITDLNKVVTHTEFADSNNKQSVTVIPADTIISYTPQKHVNEKKHSPNKKYVANKKTTLFTENKVVKSNRATKKQVWSRTGNNNVVREIYSTEVEGTVLKQHNKWAGKETADVADILVNAVGHLPLHKALSKDSFNTALILPVIDPVAIPSQELVTKNNTALPKLTDTLLKNSVEIKIPKAIHNHKKTEWSLMIAVGKSSLTNRSSNMNKSLDANYLNTPGGMVGTGSGSGNIGTFSNPTGGFNFSAGIGRSQSISKHFNWRAELNYQLLTAKQRTGSRNDSMIRFDAFTSTAFYTANRVANTPGTNRLNQVHRLQLASGIGYTLNQTANSPICFFAGVSVAYNISNNLLLHDYRSGSYIRSAALSNKFMLGGEAGIDVFISHKIHAGLFYQYDLTNVAKAKVGSVFRWNQMQLHIGIPVSKH